MYKLRIKTKNVEKVIENPVEPRIINTACFSNLEVKNDNGNWIPIVRYLNLSYLEEEKDTEEIVLKEIKYAIKNHKNYVFVDV